MRPSYCAAVVFVLLLTACGGGGGGGHDADWLYPLWVPTEVAVADVDGDGASDLAATSSTTGSAHLELLYQDAAQRGSFRPAVALTVPGTATTGVAAGDLDGDGRNETVVLGSEGRFIVLD